MAKSEEQKKVFTIAKTKKGRTVLRINEGQFVLDEKEQYRLIRFFNRICDPQTLPYPESGSSTYITYDNGINAVTLSAGRLDNAVTKFFLNVVYMTPNNQGYNSDAFFLNRATVENYMQVLGTELGATQL